MSHEFSEIADSLCGLGWDVRRRDEPLELGEDVAGRYQWLPDEITVFLQTFDEIVSPSQRAWFITCTDLAGESKAAFAWNQWELDSLSAAANDPVWQQSIRAFWDVHFPILLSVSSGYGYVAIRKDCAIVAGVAPDFEETENIAGSFQSFLQLLATGDPRVALLI